MLITLDIHLAEYRPLNGCSNIELPEFVAKKKAVVNMENKDEACFKWVVTRVLNPVVSNPKA